MGNLRYAIAAAAVLGALIGLAPVANAGPYAGPHCSPSARDYDSAQCSLLPQNNPECSAYGDADRCVQDWMRYQKNEHDFYAPTPN